MSEALTPDVIRTGLFELTGYDTTAAKKAIDFVNDEPRKYDLFKRLWAKNGGQSLVVQADITITKVTEAESLLFAAPKATK
ncbi:DUF2560 family protein [Providencia alcalifaciens]|uniref:DUF2560 family protein n=1 Tax=Moellerella wisconsensis TaxID=158849 RepID=UPI00291092B0|nr:DUF2560 family protein [Providencia rettgeri]MDU7495761.1 DUF2560 family protein [Providencia rettgeri]